MITCVFVRKKKIMMAKENTLFYMYFSIHKGYVKIFYAIQGCILNISRGHQPRLSVRKLIGIFWLIGAIACRTDGHSKLFKVASFIPYASNFRPFHTPMIMNGSLECWWSNFKQKFLRYGRFLIAIYKLRIEFRIRSWSEENWVM